MTDLGRLLDLAERSLVTGGFGYLGTDGAVLPGRPLETWITARMTHVFGLAALLGRPGADGLVRSGVEALTGGPLRDAEHGGWYAAADDPAKTAYVHAFVVLAGATATAAGDPGGRTLLDAALEVWQTRFWDDAAGLAVEEWDPGWTRLSDYRGANANMHGVEASLAAADALGDGDPRAGRLRAQALRSAERIVHDSARARDWRLPEHFTPDWTPLPGYNRDQPAHPFRPYGVTVGHQFEWARLCVHLHAALGDRDGDDGPPAWLLDDAVALFDAAATRGWAADGHDGFPYTLDWDDRPVVGARMHWVLCEAVAAAAVLGQVTGEQRYRDLADRWWAHGERHFADESTGSWHHELTPEGEVASDTWAGQPDAYHLAQVLLLRESRPVRGSVTAALR